MSPQESYLYKPHLEPFFFKATGITACRSDKECSHEISWQQIQETMVRHQVTAFSAFMLHSTKKPSV